MSKRCNTLYGLLFFVFGEISTLYTHYCTKSFLIPVMTLENRLFFSKLNSRATLFVSETVRLVGAMHWDVHWYMLAGFTIANRATFTTVTAYFITQQHYPLPGIHLVLILFGS